MDRFLMRPWTKEIAKATSNALTVRIFPGGALGKGPVDRFKRAVDGVANVTFGLPGFTSKLFPRTGVIKLPRVAKNAVVAANQLWDAFPLLAPEWRRVEVLALWTNERQTLMTKNKPICSIAEDVPMSEIFIGILPFWLAMVACLVLLIAFPQIALFLPNTMIN
jgi:TRAP-type transport system periplasmic protein